MAFIESNNHFELFVTCVDKVGPMLKIWGQIDRLSSMFVEQLLKTTSVHLEAASGLLHLSKLHVGLLCCAKYKDGHYYRAQITNLRYLVSGAVEVKFIDYGNVEIITVENIRLLENVPLGLTTMKPQAVDFVLANVIHINQQWDDKALSFIHAEIAYMELKTTVLGAVNNFRFIKVMFHDTDLAEYLIQRGIATQVSLVYQETLVRAPKANLVETNQIMSPQPQYTSVMPTAYTTVRNVDTQSHYQQPLMSPTPVTVSTDLCRYKCLPLEANSEHMVYVSYVEDGPFLFSIQLQAMEGALEKLMIEINQITTLLPLSETPLPGYPCMARCVEDNSLCRAVVVNLVEDKCKIYFVDFGNTDTLSFSNIFQIPFKYVLPKVMSMRYTLHGLKHIKVNDEMKCAFKEFVTNRLLKLKVLKLDDAPVLQSVELYDEENTNIINILFDQVNKYKTLQLSKGMKYKVIVSFIEGCKKFFIQLKECSDTLNTLMLALANTCENSPELQSVEVGKSCVAFYSGDNQWYRAQILSIANDTATVKYIDYGNEDTVPLKCLKQIDPNFVKILPAQAVECCLYGYQNMSFDTEIECVFESLTLECEFDMRVINKQNDDTTLLVDLFDAACNNVAALLIEKLASQKSQLSPLPANKMTRSLLNNEENMNPNVEYHYVEVKSPKPNTDKPSWRNSANDKSSWKSSGNEKKNFGNSSEEKQTSWRNAEDSPPKNRVQNDNWNGDSPTNKRTQRNERSFSRSSNSPNRPREGGKFNKRSPPQNDSAKGNSWNNNGSGSEKSWSGASASSRGKNAGYKKEFKQGKRNNDFPKKNDFSRQNDFPRSDKRKLPVELPPQDLAPLTEPFNYMEITPKANELISISWFYNPENFFCQLLKNEKEFRYIMNEIQSAYSGRPALNTNTDIPVGASIIAEFHEDSILYRATVLENKYPKYKVQYIDFGNMSLVDNNKIWQVEKKFMNLPMQAIKCSLSSIQSAETNWPVSDVIDNLFNRESFKCSFVGCDADKYFIQLHDNDIDIRQKLIETGIAIDPTSVCQMADDPIELNILIGQNIRTTVSFIQGLDKFYVHLQQEKATIVQKSIDTFMKSTDIATLPQFSQDQITIGATCLVQVDNETWKRGVVTDNSDLSSIQVQYPDFGGYGSYSAQKIFVLPQQLCVYWYQGFECSLHNLSDQVTKLITDEDFKKNYEGQELIIYVDELVNARLIVTLYDTTGNKLALIDPDEDAYPTVEPICPMPIIHAVLSVFVSHVNNVGSIYLQRESDGNNIPALLERLFEFYESKDEIAEFNKGDLCCTKSVNDGNWYRGRIEDLKDDTAQILYIDYGNSETVPKENLRVLDQSFFTHELAIHVELNLQETSPELTDKINELTADKLFSANMIYGDSGWIVDLTDGETSLSQTLVDLNLASFVENISPVIQDTITEETESELLTTEPTDESRAQVTITHIDSPSEFYVQLLANDNSISSLQIDLQEKVKELPDLEGADIGVLCAAKYTVDEQWYRAEVLDADAEITTVRFVDYGNTDVIANNQGSIKTLPAELLAVDKYARKCSLNIMPNKGEEWAQEASEIFENAVNSDAIHADIVYQDEKNKTYVELYVNGNNVAEKLLTANLATTITRDAEDNLANNTGFVSHVNSVSEFWIQLESSVPDLEMIVDRLANADTFSDLQDLSPGILCAANFPDDEMWYRARILSNTVAGIEVLFVDYGNSSTAMKLKVLPEDLIQMPILGQKCSLNKPSNIASWSEQANEKFREISEEGATIFSIRKLTAGETSVVELFIDGNNIVDQLIDLCEEKSTSQRTTPIHEPTYTKVHITHIEGPNYFWVQMSSDSEKIEEMTEILAPAGSFKKLTDWNADTTCAALYLDSGLWYRAKILEYVEDYEVLLVDYGNTITTNDLRALPETLADIEPFATLCTLELPKDIADWTDNMCSRFTSLVDGCTECKVEFIDNKFPSTVRLFIDGKNIIEEINSDTPQIAVASSSSVNLISDEVSLLAVNTQLPEPVTEVDEDLSETPEVEKIKTADVSEVTEVTQTNAEDIGEVEEVTQINVEDFCEVEEVTQTKVEDIDEVEEVTQANVEEIGEVEEVTQINVEDICEVEEVTQTKVEDIDEVEEVTQANVEEIGEVEEVPQTKLENIGEVVEMTQIKAEDIGQVTEVTKIKDDNISKVEQIKTEVEIAAGSQTNSENIYDTDELTEVTHINSKDIDEIATVEQIKAEKMSEVAKVEEIKAEIPMLDDSYMTAVDESEDYLLDDSNETIKEDSFIEAKSVASTVSSSNQNNNSLTRTETKPAKTIEENLVIEQLTTVETESNRPVISASDDRVIMGSFCGTANKIEDDEQNLSNEVECIIETDTTITISRPPTPHCDKIVPGSICRGDLEEPAEEDMKTIVAEVVVVSKIPSRPATPHSEKIVPGSICRGSFEQIPPNYINDNIDIPALPKCEKIVPGAICRGDLEEPPINSQTEQVDKSIKETVILEEIRPKTPIEEKIVPGSINKGMDLKEDISS